MFEHVSNTGQFDLNHYSLVNVYMNASSCTLVTPETCTCTCRSEPLTTRKLQQ